jgi:5-methyltetrahydrofolate--homocysteine methyltransferase
MMDFQERTVAALGTIVLAAVEGDIHEIGRSLVGTMLGAAGFRVIDLAVDVAPDRIGRAVQEQQADIVGLSVLLTPMVGQVRTVLEELVEAGLRSRVRAVIGGACITPELAESMGCDAHGADAVAAVRVCEALLAA